MVGYEAKPMKVRAGFGVSGSEPEVKRKGDAEETPPRGPDRGCLRHPLIADMLTAAINVCKVPEAVIRQYPGPAL